MEQFYPEDLRNELYPLVFVVSAINDADDNAHGGKPLIDRFVDSISISLKTESDPESSMRTNVESNDGAGNTNANKINYLFNFYVNRVTPACRANNGVSNAIIYC